MNSESEGNLRSSSGEPTRNASSSLRQGHHFLSPPDDGTGGVVARVQFVAEIINEPLTRSEVVLGAARRHLMRREPTVVESYLGMSHRDWIHNLRGFSLISQRFHVLIKK